MSINRIIQPIGIVAKMCVAAMFMFSLSACKKTPEGILSEEDMAQLMADIHMGEAMIDFNYADYPNDSTRKALKQSIFAEHNVTAEEVDTSFVWYGNHIEDYIKVYDRTIEIIQTRQRENANATHEQISVAGDSVQVWHGPQRLKVSNTMPSRIVPFNILPDSTWKKGDIYILSYKLINQQSDVTGRLLVDYDNGSTGYSDETTTQRNATLLHLQPDTTLNLVRIYGYLRFAPDSNTAFEVDSISLTRVRKELMPNARYRHDTFDYGDEAAVNETSDTPTVETAFSSTPATPHRHGNSSSQRNRQKVSDDNLPKSSSELGRSSEHRQDAVQNKPTPAQRRDAARQRNATTKPKQGLQLRQNNSQQVKKRPAGKSN